MRKTWLAPALFCMVLVACTSNDAGKEQKEPVYVSKHSERFNTGTDALLVQYDSLSAAFVNWDGAGINKNAKLLHDNLENLPLNKEDVLPIFANPKDSLQLVKSWQGSKTTSLNIALKTGMEAKKRSFNELTQNLFSFLRVLKYDNSKLYLQECPMAFNDTGAGLWISKTAEINNPYLGRHHPHYKAGMLHCGETKEEINFGNRK